VSGAAFEDVRMVRKDSARGNSSISRVSFEQVAQQISEAKGERPSKPQGVRARLEQALRPYLNEMLFTPHLILVEGPEDVAYITTLLMLRGSWEEYRRLGCHIVPTNGKEQMLEPLAIANLLGIPVFVVFDGDAQSWAGNVGTAEKHKKYNGAILELCGVADPDPMPPDTLWHERVVMWHSEVKTVASNDLGTALWRQFQEQTEAAFGHTGDLDKKSMFIAELLTRAWEAGQRFATLERLCDKILDFARTPRRMAA
jgi:predicted ATP-dependent endonuclease of OLD family